MKKFEKPVIDICMFDEDEILTASGELQTVENPTSYTGDNTAGNGKELETTNLLSFTW